MNIRDNFNVESFYQEFNQDESFGAFNQDQNEPKTFILLAYHKYLLRRSGGDADVLVQIIFNDILHQSDAVFELLGHVTDGPITKDTLRQAAELLINSNK